MATSKKPTKQLSLEEKKADQTKRLVRHQAKKESAAERLHQKFQALGDAALLDEYEAAAYLSCSVQKLRLSRVNGGNLPFLKIGAAVRYRLGDIKGA